LVLTPLELIDRIAARVDAQPEWDASIQITPDYQVDQLQ